MDKYIYKYCFDEYRFCTYIHHFLIRHEFLKSNLTFSTKTSTFCADVLMTRSWSTLLINLSSVMWFERWDFIEITSSHDEETCNTINL